MKYIITYDNGSGYREAACTPQDTPEQAWAAAGLVPGQQIHLGSDPKLENMTDLSKLRELGLELSHGHDYGSTDHKSAPSTESLEYVVFRVSEMPQGQAIKSVSANSSETTVTLTDGSQYEGEIWHSSDLDVVEDAKADVERENAVALIKPAFEWAEQNNPKYLDGIINRKTGSQWAGEFKWQEIVDIYWQVDDGIIPIIHQPNCIYLAFVLNRYIHPSFLNGTQNIRLLADFSRKELKSVKLTEGSHGLELVSHLVDPKKARIVWLILGDAYIDNERIEGHKMPWACFPGELTASIKHIPEDFEWDGSVLDLWAIAKEGLPIAVKGIN